MLIKNDGGEETNLDFTMGPGTSVYFSCSAKLNGDFYIFGGFGSDNRQVKFFLTVKEEKTLLRCMFKMYV